MPSISQKSLIAWGNCHKEELPTFTLSVLRELDENLDLFDKAGFFAVIRYNAGNQGVHLLLQADG